MTTKQRRQQEYEMYSNSECAALDPVPQNGNDIIMEPPSVQENNASKIRMKEVAFIFLRELFGMSIYTFVADIAKTNMLSHGIIYAALQASAEISSSGGLHLNPVITLATVISGRMKPILALPMILAQLIGCLLGPVFCLVSQSEKEFIGEERYSWHHDIYRIFQVEDGVELNKYICGEILITTILVSVFLRLFPLKTRELPANEKERQETENRKYIHALFVGLTITALTGIRYQVRFLGLMNPFQSFGYMVVWVTSVQQTKDHSIVNQLNLKHYDMDGNSVSSVSQLWRGHWVYWVGPFVGGILAGVVDRLRGCCQGYSPE